MPGNPAKLIKNAQDRQAFLRAQREYYRLKESHIPLPPAPRTNTSVARCMNEIFVEFNEESDQVGKLDKMPAETFRFLMNKFNPGTITQAKKYLGVKSIRRKDKWYWTPPKRTPTEAFAEVYQRKIEDGDPFQNELNELDRDSVKLLASILREGGYSAQNATILRTMMSQELYSRSAVLQAKRILGVASVKTNGFWFWVWPDKPVQEWLLAKLANGPIASNRLKLDAMAEHEWLPELLAITKKILPQIQVMNSHGSVMWYDINTYSHKDELIDIERARIVEIDNLPEPEDDRTVIVDFSPEDEVHDLSPDESTVPVHPDTPVKEKEVITVNGLRIETFK